MQHILTRTSDTQCLKVELPFWGVLISFWEDHRNLPSKISIEHFLQDCTRQIQCLWLEKREYQLSLLQAIETLWFRKHAIEFVKLYRPQPSHCVDMSSTSSATTVIRWLGLYDIYNYHVESQHSGEAGLTNDTNGNPSFPHTITIANEFSFPWSVHVVVETSTWVTSTHLW